MTSTPGPTDRPGPPAPLTCACGATVPPTWEDTWGSWWSPDQCAPCRDAWRRERQEAKIAEGLEAAQIPARWRDLSLERTMRLGDAGREPWPAFRERLEAQALPTMGITTWNATAARTVRAWRPEAPGPHGVILLAGPVGGGKSALSLAGLGDAIRRDPDLDALFMPEPTLLEIMRLEASGARKRGMLARVSQVRALVLDELGSTERISDWHRDAIEFLIGTRYNAALPTLITTNLTLPELGELYGDRVLSRLVESLGGVRRQLPGFRELVGVDWRTDTPHPPTPKPSPPKSTTTERLETE
jgi:hypothetical protein